MKRKLISRNKKRLSHLIKLARVFEIDLGGYIGLIRTMAKIKSTKRLERKCVEIYDFADVNESCLGYSVPIKLVKKNGDIFDTEMSIIARGNEHLERLKNEKYKSK